MRWERVKSEALIDNIHFSHFSFIPHPIPLFHYASELLNDSYKIAALKSFSFETGTVILLKCHLTSIKSSQLTGIMKKSDGHKSILYVAAFKQRIKKFIAHFIVNWTEKKIGTRNGYNWNCEKIYSLNLNWTRQMNCAKNQWINSIEMCYVVLSLVNKSNTNMRILQKKGTRNATQTAIGEEWARERKA